MELTNRLLAETVQLPIPSTRDFVGDDYPLYDTSNHAVTERTGRRQ
jgi:hypothetical protein